MVTSCGADVTDSGSPLRLSTTTCTTWTPQVPADRSRGSGPEQASRSSLLARCGLASLTARFLLLGSAAALAGVAPSDARAARLAPAFRRAGGVRDLRG